MTDRRRIVAALGAIAIAVLSPGIARAQRKGVPHVGVLDPVSSTLSRGRLDVLRKALRDLGYEDGRNVVLEPRWAEGQYDRLPVLAAELVRLRVDVIVAATPPALEAAKRATTSIPIVMIAIPNPVMAGFVTSLARPGGNITGLSNISVDLSVKYVELLHAALPSLARVGMLVNPRHPNHPDMLRNVQASAAGNNILVRAYPAATPDDIAAAIAEMAGDRTDAMIALPDAFYSSQRRQIVDLVNAARLPSMFWTRELAEAGGLMSYGQSNSEHFRLAATYVDRILKGAKPGDLPVEQPTRIELVVNRATARRIGIVLPQALIVRADELLDD